MILKIYASFATINNYLLTRGFTYTMSPGRTVLPKQFKSVGFDMVSVSEYSYILFNDAITDQFISEMCLRFNVKVISLRSTK